MKNSILILLCFVIFESKAQHVGSKKNFKHGTIDFIDSVSSFNIIEDLLSLPVFKDKIVYIDLWGTTCIPCLREFPFSEQLYNKYLNKNVAFLYICYNFHGNANDEARKKWKELSLKYHLRGTHVYTYILPPNKIIHTTIDNKFEDTLPAGAPSAYGIPMYFIAKNGKLIMVNAQKPSVQLNLPINQIDSINNIK